MNLQLVTIFILINYCLAVKDYLFKSCNQNGFCHRNRHYANQISLDSNFQSPYYIDFNQIKIDGDKLRGTVLKIGFDVKFPFEISVIENSFRFQLDEIRNPIEHFVNHNRYNETSKWAFNKDLSNDKADYKINDDQILMTYSDNHEVIINLNPIKFTFYYKNEEVLLINDKQFLLVEHQRSIENNKLLPQESSFNMFSDDFKDSKSDKLPLGPESIGLDFTLLGFNNLYGIPEHADSMLLKDTSGKEPYRFYNVDIFEYETDSRLPMYGSIPLLTAVKKDVSIGIFWVNSADSYIDIKKGKDSTIHWISENGILDFIIFIKDTPKEINQVYGKITGFTQLPLLSSLGYHQCRWNYNDIKDVLEVSAKFDEFEIPFDTIWLDIEYADNKKYLTWDPQNFGKPDEMLEVLERTGRNLVAIIDPHIKTGYFVSDAIISKNIGMKDNEDNTYRGHCWPGESIWIDTLNPKSQKFWDDVHKTFMISDNHKNLHLWNDMNEPSVFNGPETSAPKDNIHYGQWEHRSIHNVFGLTYHETTYNSMLSRLPEQRPFILTRSYFSGSQRTAAMWTGDNMSKWEYLKVSIPMILTSNIVGMPFAGADVGGFFGNPSKELLTRWYQAGIWYPFFRAHAHIDSRRREPYLIGEPYTSYIRDAIKLRYSLLPIFYTAFYQASISGSPILKPIFYDYYNSTNSNIFEIEDEFFLGDSGILVKPITDEEANEVEFVLPENEIFYQFTNGIIGDKINSSKFKVGINDIPMLLKGGSIIAKKERYRRSSKLMKHDPYTLIIALNIQGYANGQLYVDDGESIDSEFKMINFEFENGKLSVNSTGDFSLPIEIEKAIIVGANEVDPELGPVTIEDEKLVIKNPRVIIC
ncbi:ROT2 [Candida pseudojiufengensis]|uniref:ROT2 n=1 Tax=Candida pseudojiufengensis TaxID=497109 RepID=UPI00222435C6|nr:ROT2 [Candida pseudojiufengensis]KAI5964054.1 ROT2 [Candida pseudojiufengensis]